MLPMWLINIESEKVWSGSFSVAGQMKMPVSWKSYDQLNMFSIEKLEKYISTTATTKKTIIWSEKRTNWSCFILIITFSKACSNLWACTVKIKCTQWITGQCLLFSISCFLISDPFYRPWQHVACIVWGRGSTKLDSQQCKIQWQDFEWSWDQIKGGVRKCVSYKQRQKKERLDSREGANAPSLRP